MNRIYHQNKTSSKKDPCENTNNVFFGNSDKKCLSWEVPPRFASFIAFSAISAAIFMTIHNVRKELAKEKTAKNNNENQGSSYNEFCQNWLIPKNDSFYRRKYLPLASQVVLSTVTVFLGVKWLIKKH